MVSSSDRLLIARIPVWSSPRSALRPAPPDHFLQAVDFLGKKGARLRRAFFLSQVRGARVSSSRARASNLCGIGWIPGVVVIDAGRFLIRSRPWPRQELGAAPARAAFAEAGEKAGTSTARHRQPATLLLRFGRCSVPGLHRGLLLAPFPLCFDRPPRPPHHSCRIAGPSASSLNRPVRHDLIRMSANDG